MLVHKVRRGDTNQECRGSFTCIPSEIYRASHFLTLGYAKATYMYTVRISQGGKTSHLICDIFATETDWDKVWRPLVHLYDSLLVSNCVEKKKVKRRFNAFLKGVITRQRRYNAKWKGVITPFMHKKGVIMPFRKA